MKRVFARVAGVKKVSVLVVVASLFSIHAFATREHTVAFPTETETTASDITAEAVNGTTLPFIENEGQVGNDAVKYYVNTFAGSVFVTDRELRYSVAKRGERQDSADSEPAPIESVAFDERFLDNDGVPMTYAPEGKDASDIPVSYFRGSDPEDWKTDVGNYGSLSLGEVWAGIDVGLKARGKNFEKIFTVNPGADPDAIAVGFDGIDGIALGEDGTLRVITPLGDVSMTAPVAYQTGEDGTGTTVPVSYDIRDDRRYGFAIGDYDRTKPLVIDPLIAGSFIGTGDEELYSMTIDSDGNVFVAGTTGMTDFPVTVGAYQQTFGGETDDFFISKFDAGLTELLASTYLGGAGRSSYGIQIEADSSGDIYMTGSSTVGYPVTSEAYQTTCATSSSFYRCGVVSKLDNDLTDLLASTYLGNVDTHSYGLDIDSNGKVFVTGDTRDTAFPVSAGAYDEIFGNEIVAYVSRLDADLTTVEASTFIGDGGSSYSVKMGSGDDVFITGVSRDDWYPTTPEAYDTDNSLGTKFFISKLDNDLSHLIASTFFGSEESRMISGNPNMMALDASDNVYITESTDDSDFPTTSGAYQETIGGDTDAFIAKLSGDLETLLASTFLGGANYEESEGALMIDADGNVFTAVYIYAYDVGSQDFPTTPDAYQPTCDPDIFEAAGVLKLSNDLSVLSASTYLLTSNDEYVFPYALAVNSSGHVHVAGAYGTYAGDPTSFPITPDAYQAEPAGDYNGAIAVFDNDLSGTPIVAVPAIATDTPADITSTSVTLNATLTDDGNETPTVTFAWGTESGTYPNTCSPVGNEGDDYSCGLTGLTADTTYYFQASATNSAGTGTGSEVSFRTEPADDDDGTVPVDGETSDGDDDSPGITDDECRPMKFSATVSADGDVRLSWKKPCGSIDKVRIERAFGDGPFEKIATVRKDKRGYTDGGSELLSGEYTYRIRGYREASGKYSDYSRRRSVTIARSEPSGTVVSDEPAPPPSTAEEADGGLPVREVQVPGDTSDSGNHPSGSATRSDPTEPSILGEAVEAVGRFVRNFLSELTVAVFVGLAAGVAIVASPTGIPLFSTSPAPLTEFVSRMSRMIGFIGKKKREDDWGIVFDGDTRRPLSGVPVSIMDENGHVLGVSVSDASGRYGFLPTPGEYVLGISGKGYDLETANPQDILYGELYTGRPIRVEDGGMKKISIALRSTTVDWREFARKKIATYTSVFSIVKRDLFLVLFYSGFIINAGIVYLFPTGTNVVLFGAYLAMLFYYVFFRKRKRYGLVTDARTGRPVPFAMLSAYDATDSGKRVAFAVSDVLGHYFMFTENGTYLLKAAGRFLGGENFEKTVRIRIRDGIVRSDLEV